MMDVDCEIMSAKAKDVRTIQDLHIKQLEIHLDVVVVCHRCVMLDW